MLKLDEVSIRAVDHKSLPFLVKWVNSGKLLNQGKLKKKTNLVEQSRYLDTLTENNQALSIYIKDIDQPVGICEIAKIDYVNRTCHMNLFIEDQKKVFGPYGSKILDLVLEYVFKRLGLYKISTDIPIDDSITTSLFKQHDFKIEVRKRDHLFANGKYNTVIEMGLLKHEFEQEHE